MFILILLHLLVVLISSTNHSLTEVICNFGFTDALSSSSPHRLPRNIFPIAYDLSYIFDYSLSSFFASVDIDFVAKNTTDRVIFHSNKLDITSIGISNIYNPTPTTVTLEIMFVCSIPDEKLVVLSLNRNLNVGENATLSISFQGNVSESLNGIYSSTYVTKANETKKTLSTHFEPDFARNAFPCWDEPVFKSTFVVQLTYPQNYNALSNAPTKSTTLLKDDWILMEFKPTPVMSTYLLAFVIHDFDSISAVSESGKKINVWLPTDMLDQGKFAIELAPKALNLFEHMFNITYAIEKLDLIGIPGFEAGAMENWGLITFRMSLILVNNKFTTPMRKQHVGQTIVHEIAHQWFGNLVTMEWWNDIWLNEGFATFMESYVMNILFPSWRIMDQFSYSLLLSGMAYDQLPVTHPVSMPIDSQENIHLLFDHISYNKGAALLYSLMNSIGETTFFNCIQIYLQKYAYSNSDSLSLWEIVINETKQQVIQDMMISWTEQAGFPLVTISNTNQSGVYNISQERFLLTADDKKIEASKNDAVVWVIPINYISSLNPTNPQQIWLKSKSNNFDFNVTAKWIKLNYNFGYFYRSNYNDQMWKELLDQMKIDHTVFSAKDRLSLISDLFGIVHIGIKPISFVLNFIEYIKNETDYFVISETIFNLNYIYRILGDYPTIKNSFRNYMFTLFNVQYQQFQWHQTSDRFERLIQIKILGMKIILDDNETLLTAKKQFEQHVSSKTFVEPDIFPLVVCAAVKTATEQEWENLFDRYKLALDLTERDIYRNSLTCTENTNILSRLLSITLNSSIIPLQDAIDLMTDVAATEKGGKLAWDFLKTHWNELINQYRDIPNSFGSLISGIAGRLKTRQDFEDVKSFFTKNGEEFMRRSIEQSLELIGLRSKWIDNNLNDLLSWLRSNHF